MDHHALPIAVTATLILVKPATPVEQIQGNALKGYTRVMVLNLVQETGTGIAQVAIALMILTLTLVFLELAVRPVIRMEQAVLLEMYATQIHVPASRLELAISTV